MSPFWDTSDTPKTGNPWASLGGRGSDNTNSFISWFLGGGDDSEDAGRGQEHGGQTSWANKNVGSGGSERSDSGGEHERERSGGEVTAGGRVNDGDEGRGVPGTVSGGGEEGSGGRSGGRDDDSSSGDIRGSSIGDGDNEDDGRDHASAGNRGPGRPSSNDDDAGDADDNDEIRVKDRPVSLPQPEDAPVPSQPSSEPSAKTAPTVSSPDDDAPSSRPSGMSVSSTTDDTTDDDAESDDTGRFVNPIAPSSTSSPSDRTTPSESSPTNSMLSSTPTVSSTPTPSSSGFTSANNSTDSPAESDSGPPVAGIVAGVVLGVLAILALIFFFRYRHTKRNNPYSSRRSLLLQSAGLRRSNGGAILLNEDSPAPSPGLVPNSQFQQYQQSYYQDERSMAQDNQGHEASYPQGMIQVPPQVRTPSIRSVATTDSGPGVSGFKGAISMFPMPPSVGEPGRSRCGSEAGWSGSGSESPRGYGYRGYGTHPAYQPDWTPVRPRAREGSV